MTVTRTEVADILEWLARYEGEPYHALLTDPPYHLTTITKRFGKPGSAPAKEGTDGLFARASRGFMGQVWDGGDIAFRPETWAAFLPHLHPGAFGMAFGSSRGWHRLACAIEDAGFIIHPSIFLYLYGSGFPKATRVERMCHCAERHLSTQTDAAIKEEGRHHSLRGMRKGNNETSLLAKESANADLLPQVQWDSEGSRVGDACAQGQGGLDPGKRSVLPTEDERPSQSSMEGRCNAEAAQRELSVGSVCQMPAGDVRDGAQGRLHHGAPDGHGSQVGKDAIEDGNRPSPEPRPARQPARKPRVMARQPLSQDERRGALCDRCGLPTDDGIWAGHRYGLQALKPAAEPIIVFQKPYEGRPVDDITRTGAGALNVDGARIATDAPIAAHRGTGRGVAMQGNAEESWPEPYKTGDAGPENTQSLGRWPANFALVHHPDCGEQCVEGCPVAALDSQTPTSMHARGNKTAKRVPGSAFFGEADTIEKGDPGDSGSAARFFYSGDWQAEALEQADPVLYAAKASVSEREAGLHLDGSEGRRCTHPTVKPIALARWLATLLLPPEQYAPRRILIPFSGVASEMIGAGLAGWEYVQGVELSKEYAELGAIRLEWWMGRGWQIPLFGG